MRTSGAADPGLGRPGPLDGSSLACPSADSSSPRASWSSSVLPTPRLPPLRALHAAGHEVACVVTQPDRRRGRGERALAEPGAGRRGMRARAPRPHARALGRDRRRRRGVAAPSSASWSRSVRSCPRGPARRAAARLRERALLAAAAGGAARRRWSGRCSPVTPRPACASWRWKRGSTPDRSTHVRSPRSLPTRPPASCKPAWWRRAPTSWSRRCRRCRTSNPSLSAASPPTPTRSRSEEFELDWELPAFDLARIVRAGNPRPGAWTFDHGKRLKVWRARALSAGIEQAPGHGLRAHACRNR